MYPWLHCAPGLREREGRIAGCVSLRAARYRASVGAPHGL